MHMSNWNSKRCGCGGRRPRGCLNSIGGPHGWYGCPGYTGGCPDADDAEQNDALDAGQECPRRRRCRRAVCGIFTAALPMAVAANGVVPLNGCGADGGLSINGGLVTVETPGIIEEHSVDYVPSFDDSKTGDDSGHHKWTFAPVQPGTTLVKLAYTRPWEDKESEAPAAAATYRFTVDEDLKLNAELLEHSDNFNDYILSVG